MQLDDGTALALIGVALLTLARQSQLRSLPPTPRQAAMSDSDLIDALGGCTRVAQRLQMDRRRGAQRVCNWRKRGIPARVKLAHPEVFLRTELAGAAPPVPQAEEVRDAA